MSSTEAPRIEPVATLPARTKRCAAFERDLTPGKVLARAAQIVDFHLEADRVSEALTYYRLIIRDYPATEEAFDAVLATNLRAAMFLAQEAAKRQKRGGKQVHLLSVRAQLGVRGRGYSAYCASKGGLVMLVKQHASELGARGICVNGVAPTVVRTEMGAHWLKNPKTRAWLRERIPLGRVAEPGDVAGAVLFFCSPASDFVTGQILYVDGGITASQ